MVLHLAFRARRVRNTGIGGEARHCVTSGVSCETSLTKYVTPHLRREQQPLRPFAQPRGSRGPEDCRDLHVDLLRAQGLHASADADREPWRHVYGIALFVMFYYLFVYVFIVVRLLYLLDTSTVFLCASNSVADRQLRTDT